MNIYTNKIHNTKTEQAAAVLPGQQVKSEPGIQYNRNPPGTIENEKLLSSINSSLQVQQLKAVKGIANNSVQVKQLRVIQLLANNSTAAVSVSRDATIQLNDEEDAVKEVRKMMPHGPGNIAGSSKEAQQSLKQARDLEELLLHQNDYQFDRDKNDYAEVGTSPQSIIELGRDSLYRKNIMEGDKRPVGLFINKQDKPVPRKNFAEEAEQMKALTELVWRAFTLEKTGGGTCDHISAATFLELIKKGKKPVWIYYEPESDGEYSIENKRGGPGHSSVLLVDEKETEKATEVDGWWPDEGRIRIFESQEDAVKKIGKGRKLKWKWEPDQQEFIDAVKKELELRYADLEQKNKLPVKDNGYENTVDNLWEIAKK